MQQCGIFPLCHLFFGRPRNICLDFYVQLQEENDLEVVCHEGVTHNHAVLYFCGQDIALIVSKVGKCGRVIFRLRAVSYSCLQSYYTRNLSTRAAKPLSPRNEGVSPRRKKIRSKLGVNLDIYINFHDQTESTAH